MRNPAVVMPKRLTLLCLFACRIAMGAGEQEHVFNLEIQFPSSFAESEVESRTNKIIEQNRLAGRWTQKLADINRPLIRAAMLEEARGVTRSGTITIYAGKWGEEVHSFVPMLGVPGQTTPTIEIWD